MRNSRSSLPISIGRWMPETDALPSYCLLSNQRHALLLKKRKKLSTGLIQYNALPNSSSDSRQPSTVGACTHSLNRPGVSYFSLLFDFPNTLVDLLFKVSEIDYSILSLAVCPSPMLTYHRLTEYPRNHSVIHAANIKVSQGYFKGAMNTAVEPRANTYQTSFALHVHFEGHS